MKNRVLIALGILGILDTAILLILIDTVNVGTLFPGIAGLAIVAIGINNQYKVLHLSMNRWIKLLILSCVVAGVLSFVIIEGLIIFSVGSEEDIKPDYLIILGAGLRGEELSLSLHKRMEKGVDYLKNNPDVSVIVSGGQGSGETISEAEAMKDYLVAHGIDNDKIIKEDKSTSTMENFSYTKDILSPTANEKIKLLIVTNDFHIFRSKLLARRNGFAAYGLPCETPWSILPNCYIREYFAVWKSLILDK